MADKTYLAKTEIHITTKPGVAAKGSTPAKAPEVTVVAAKTKFIIDSNSDTLAELLAAGACVLAKDDDAKQPTKVATPKKSAPTAKKTTAKKPAAAAADADGEGDGDGSDMV